MTLHSRTAAAACLALLCLTGCITTVDVKKLTAPSTQTGLRYSLPATFLLVQPQADGTASYSWVYLPDTDNTYTIEQHAYLAKFTMDVTVSNGLLSKVNAQSDNTSTLAGLLDAGQSAYAAKEQVISTQNKTNASTLASAKTAATAAGLLLTQAQSDLKLLQASPTATPALLVAAKQKVADAQLASDQAQKTLRDATNGAADLPTGPQKAQQWGPVLFRVTADSTGNVQLQAVNVQTQFDTVAAASSATPAATGAYTLSLAQTTFSAATKPLQLNLAISPAVSSTDASQSSLTLNGNPLLPLPNWTFSLAADGKTLTVTIPNGLAAGSYVFGPAVIPTAGGKAVVSKTVQFKVQ